VKIGVVGPSFVIPEVEFRMGLAQIKEAGISTVVHRQCKKRHRFFAGTDEERARAFFEFAIDPRFSAVWCGRGGYGAARILPLLEKMAADRGVPERKLLLGYSDATALIEFVRTRWGWETLHSPMPGMRKFCAQTQSEWKSLVGFITGDRKHQAPWEKKPLKFAGKKPSLPVEGQLVGGNLTVWTSLLGTPYAPMPKNKILFFEDTDESLYRLDRMAQQLWMAGGLKGARAIVLGNFQNCKDAVARVLASEPKKESEKKRLLLDPRPEELVPLRGKLDADKEILRIFKDIADRAEIPLAYGLPVGHGPGIASLPLGAEYRLGRDGTLQLENWRWRG
jgi:muramoyltetrapeptide carboxypeptidase